MKNARNSFLWVLPILLAALFAPATSSAHGGVQQAGGHSIVSYYQEPLSIEVDAPVTMTFIIRGLDQQPLPNLEVVVAVIESVDANAANDQAVDRRHLKTDANGALTISRSFPRPNYFDIELTYTTPDGEGPDTVGFLLQPTPVHVDRSLAVIVGGAGLLLGTFLGWLIARRNIVQITSNN